LTALADAGVALPTGWLWEDGGTYSRTTYANLFAAVTTTLTGSRARSPAFASSANVGLNADSFSGSGSTNSC